MLKYLAIIIGCVCVTLILSEATAAVILWRRGMLSPHHLREIRLVITNGYITEDRESEEKNSSKLPSVQEVARSRAVKILDLDKRESEIGTLSSMATSRREELETHQSQFRAQRDAFAKELQELNDSITSAAAEQARGVLVALPPKEAVDQLMRLSLEQDVVLMKGMSDKTVAKILKEFANTTPTIGPGAPAETPAQRGRKIFEALSRGEPARSFVENKRRDLFPDSSDGNADK
jgi:flagellar motility protein MotE (MotC chaperone)